MHLPRILLSFSTLALLPFTSANSNTISIVRDLKGLISSQELVTQDANTIKNTPSSGNVPSMTGVTAFIWGQIYTVWSHMNREGISPAECNPVLYHLLSALETSTTMCTTLTSISCHPSLTNPHTFDYRPFLAENLRKIKDSYSNLEFRYEVLCGPDGTGELKVAVQGQDEALERAMRNFERRCPRKGKGGKVGRRGC